MLTMYDQAFVMEESISEDNLVPLVRYAESLEEHRMATEAQSSGASFYRFISLSVNSKPIENIPEDVISAVDACHRVLFRILRENTTLPILEEDYTGISICSNYSMAYHADAERPFCTKDRNLGIPEGSGNGGFVCPSKNEWQPNHTPTRVYTTLVYLNEGFEGGETTMPTRNIDIKPKKGRMFGFPCSRDYIHGIRKNLGVRMAFTSWYKFSAGHDDPYGNSIKSCF